MGVTPIEGKIIENHSRWFGHVQRKPCEAPIRKVEQIILNPDKRGRGRLEKTLMKVVD